MDTNFSEKTFQVCAALLAEYIEKCNSLDRVIFRDFDKLIAIHLLKQLNQVNIDPRASIPTADLKKLSEIYTIIGAYTAPFLDTKKCYSVFEIYAAVDELIDFANSN